MLCAVCRLSMLVEPTVVAYVAVAGDVAVAAALAGVVVIAVLVDVVVAVAVAAIVVGCWWLVYGCCLKVAGCW